MSLPGGFGGFGVDDGIKMVGIKCNIKKDLNKLNRLELEELLKHQDLLLKEKLILNLLPDKGAKLKESRQSTEDALKRMIKKEENARFLESTNLVQEFEWRMDLGTNTQEQLEDDEVDAKDAKSEVKLDSHQSESGMKKRETPTEKVVRLVNSSTDKNTSPSTTTTTADEKSSTVSQPRVAVRLTLEESIELQTNILKGDKRPAVGVPLPSSSFTPQVDNSNRLSTFLYPKFVSTKVKTGSRFVAYREATETNSDDSDDEEDRITEESEPENDDD